MKLRFASVLVSGFVAASAIGQQQQSPFTPPATGGASQPATGQTTTPANQGVATNPSGAATNAVQPGASATDPALGTINTNQTGGGNAPLFLNVTPTTITDSTGAPIGVLQQISLSPSGTVNFAIVNMGGRMTPVPWQLVVSGTGGARGTLGVNTNAATIRNAPPVAMGQLPMLTQDEVQAQILNHFGLLPAQPSVATAGTLPTGVGRPAGLGVTITGGAGSTTPGASATFTNSTTIGTNTNGFANITNGIPNSMRTNQAMNTTGGLLSPTGSTNGIRDPYNSGPGSLDRLGPRNNANQTQPTPAPTRPAPAAPPAAPAPAPTIPQ